MPACAAGAAPSPPPPTTATSPHPSHPPHAFPPWCRFLPRNVAIIGYARSQLTDEGLREKLRPRLAGSGDEADAFLQLCSYVAGPYEVDGGGWPRLAAALEQREAAYCGCPCARLYYLALPPGVYTSACQGLKVKQQRKACSAARCVARTPCLTVAVLLQTHCDALPDVEGSWIRVIVEKPFGRDSASSEALAAELGKLYPEAQLWRIDHYLVGTGVMCCRIGLMRPCGDTGECCPCFLAMVRLRVCRGRRWPRI